MTKKHLQYTRAFIVLAFMLTSCSDASDYDEPQPDIVTIPDSLELPDPGTIQDSLNEEDTVEIQDLSASDTSEEDIASDLSPVDLTPPEDMAIPSSCICTFKFWSTQPLPQSHAWLTGDFLETPWVDSPQAGAIDMGFQDNGINAYFHTEVVLEHTQIIQYKYIIGWPDNPGPHWAIQNGDIDPTLPNSSFTADCATECVVGP
jgi:hypothetical protein